MRFYTRIKEIIDNKTDYFDILKQKPQNLINFI